MLNEEGVTAGESTTKPRKGASCDPFATLRRGCLVFGVNGGGKALTLSDPKIRAKKPHKSMVLLRIILPSWT